jgi:hypothetical protein
METSIIISVYKDVELLAFIIDFLLIQTSFPRRQPLAKKRALNRAIHVSKNNYLIFIDGDCVPYPTFIESPITLPEENTLLCGRRTEPGEKFSKQLRTRELSVKEFVSRYVSNYFKLKNDNIRQYHDGISLNF